MSPWTIVPLDKSLLGQKSLGQTALGQKSPQTNVSLDNCPNTDGSTSSAVRHLSKIHSIEGKVKLMADEMKHNKRFS